MKAIKRNRAKINYVVDIVIGIGFLLAAASGVVLFFVEPSGGYQGGRNPAWNSAVLGLSRTTWKDVHDYAGLVMVAGVVGHFVLHWNWMVCMTRNLFRKAGRRERRNGEETQQGCPA